MYTGFRLALVLICTLSPLLSGRSCWPSFAPDERYCSLRRFAPSRLLVRLNDTRRISSQRPPLQCSINNSTRRPRRLFVLRSDIRLGFGHVLPLLVVSPPPPGPSACPRQDPTAHHRSCHTPLRHPRRKQQQCAVCRIASMLWARHTRKHRGYCQSEDPISDEYVSKRDQLREDFNLELTRTLRSCEAVTKNISSNCSAVTGPV